MLLQCQIPHWKIRTEASEALSFWRTDSVQRSAFLRGRETKCIDSRRTVYGLPICYYLHFTLYYFEAFRLSTFRSKSLRTRIQTKLRRRQAIFVSRVYPTNGSGLIQIQFWYKRFTYFAFCQLLCLKEMRMILKGYTSLYTETFLLARHCLAVNKV